MFGLSSLAMYAIVAALIYAAGAASGWRVESWHRDALELKSEKIAELQVKAEQEKAAAASAALEQTREQLNAKSQIITRTLTKVVTRRIYARACFDADGLRLANAALQGPAADTGKPDVKVPGPQPAPGRNGSVGAAKTD
jgi:hypothetical protein